MIREILIFSRESEILNFLITCVIILINIIVINDECVIIVRNSILVMKSIDLASIQGQNLNRCYLIRE